MSAGSGFIATIKNQRVEIGKAGHLSGLFVLRVSLKEVL